MMSQIQSFLPELEPMLGVAFALNLAYIGLTRFRYRLEIREFARKEMGDLADSPPQNLAQTSVYKSVARLSSLDAFDRRLFQSSDKNADLTGFWSTVYARWFECHQDRIVVVSCAFLAAFALALGTAHKVGYLLQLAPYFDADWIVLWFWIIIALKSVPVISVLAGWYTVSNAKRYAAKQVSDLKKMMQGNVHKADVPETP
jgi:hypothetical protein